MVVPVGRRYASVLLLLFCTTVASVLAQDVTEVRLKGAFLFNFARFTDWPADVFHADSPVSACVVGDRAVGEAFSQTVKGKLLAGRPIVVTFVAATTPLPACHLLYVSGVDDARVAEIVSTVRDVPILTVSDADAFTKRGGIIQIFVESGKMKFRINAKSAKRARLQLSSRLLALAEVVDEDAAAVADAPQALTQFLISARPWLATAALEHSRTDWARRFTAWGRN